MSGPSFRLDPHDEAPHAAPAHEATFNESVYTNGFDHAAAVGGWMRLGNRVNEGHAELSVCLYLPDGRVACQFGRPPIGANDRFEGGGLRYEVIDPLTRVEMSYEGELMVLDDPGLLREPRRLADGARRVPGSVRFVHEGLTAPHGGEPTSADVPTMYGRDFSLGHFNQHTRVTGHLDVGGERYELDGHGWRDHSWGPRTWQAIHWYRLFLVTFPDGRGLMALKITDEAGVTRRVGVLLVDGRYEDIVDLDVLTDWDDDHDPAAVHVGVRTAERSVVIHGDVLTVAPLRNRRVVGERMLFSRIAEGFTRYRWDDTVGYGMSEYIERVENGRPVGYPL